MGGLLVPLTDEFTVRDLAVALGLGVLIAAEPSLGTINHTLLTLEAARAVGLDVRAIVLTPWSPKPNEIERSNRETIARLGDIEVAELGHVQSPAVVRSHASGRCAPVAALVSARESHPKRRLASTYGWSDAADALPVRRFRGRTPGERRCICVEQ